ncbi:MAG: hypothetical protein M3275_13705 [Thermoproteota archaeon]|nr:hypothetical protein [Thermoproteota archaeon]
MLRPDEQPCPNCGKTGFELIKQKDENIRIEEKLIAEIATEKRNYPWFIITVIVTMSAPFITAIPNLHPIVGIAVGLGFGALSLWFGKKAYILIKRIYQS